ncbi:metal-dependent hydrolase [Inediibacterium massiliense]|uniref:metal-dependent hydrolase n=1 Tax=Inediibacterium massiliense TaxID=1658111 RepID=UPI0006B55386|nr:metal-dependent hydrolase [Inediibacterium massiliense]
MKIQFLGHSCFYLEENNFKALIDPFMTGNENCPLSPDDFSSITHIFVTHGHGDHLGDTIEIARKTNSMVITNYEIACFLGTKDITTHPMHIGGRTSFDFGVVKMTPALHGSSIETTEGMLYGGNPCGFVIKIGKNTIYHAGDTGLTMDMKLLERENIDLALLPIGGNFTMDIEDASLAVDFIKPKKVIPMHYNTFPLIKADPEKLKTQTSSEIIILNPGETYTI